MRGGDHEKDAVGLAAEPAWPAKAGAGCLFGPGGLSGKILKYSYLRNLNSTEYLRNHTFDHYLRI